ncbi:MAG: LacI family DNA-binding transcriptional regulator [Bacillota bacterium]
MEPTIRDVARLAGTSVSTVSRVLTRNGPVAETTRTRILEAIEALGYQPNSVARGLVQKRTHTIGVVIPDVANPYYGEVLRGMGDVASTHGFHLILLNADLSFVKEKDCFSLLREKQVDGLVYASGTITPEHREIFSQIGRPVMLASTCDAERPFPAVLVDSRQGAALAMEHLIGLGHRRIGLITGPLNDLVAGLPRWEGYVQTAARLGVELLPTQIAEGDYRMESGYQAMSRFLDQGLPPTAVAAASDLMAVGAMNAVLDRGLRVPDDISVIGFDNIAMASAVRPALTTVAQPMYEIGAIAMERLIRSVTGEEVPEVHWIQPSLIIRQSTAPVFGQSST